MLQLPGVGHLAKDCPSPKNVLKGEAPEPALSKAQLAPFAETQEQASN